MHPKVFFEGGIVLVYDQDKASLGEGKLNMSWNVPYIVKHGLGKGSYELEDFVWSALLDPINGIYIKNYYT
jgi:hypothetical protein